MIGQQLGSYHVLAKLGEGGMGEVYRARDTNLGREVAIKILNTSTTVDPDRIARFRREAQTLASLNHPHIAQVFGFEEHAGVQFLAMELVDGETLDHRLARGPIPVAETVAMARQMADALEAAHDKGVVHRDLKPANIALTQNDQVKVLDFGLAKAVERPAALAHDVLNSPTITSPMMTGMGMLLGTAAYMSPEQARGKPVDRRADIWAFGCVLFEMLSGRRVFEGDTATDVIAGVIHKDPPWELLPAETPDRIHRVLRRCLTKDPRQRLRDIGDARLDLDDTSAAAPAPMSMPRANGRRFAIVGAAAFALGVLIAVVTAWVVLGRSATTPAPVTRWSVALPVEAPINLAGPWSSLAISRDGKTIAYVAQTQNGRELYVRRVDDFTPQLVRGTAGVWEAFFSPDGQSIGFIAADRLKKVALTGGQPVALADAANYNSGVWGDDGTIYLGGRAGLASVTSDGHLRPLLKLQSNEGQLSHPDLLPDGSLLFTIEPNDVTSFDDARIALLTPKGDRRVVLEGGAYARYSPTGHLLYLRGGEIMTVPFDTGRLATSGPPVRLVNGGQFDQISGAGYFAISRTGVLAYVPGGPMVRERRVAWIDRHGTTTPLDLPPRVYAEPSISADGRQIAFTIRAANDDIWTYDIARAALSRLTFPHGNSQAPIWSPDGRRIVYGLDRGGVRSLVSRAVDGSGGEEPVTPAQYFQTPGSFSPDGRLLVYREDRPETGSDIFVVPMDGNRTPVPFMMTAVNEAAPTFSPDGHWIAYVSNETGRPEVFVAPYPGPGRRFQVSDGGGVFAFWRRDGREIVYSTGDRAMSVAIKSLSPFQAERPVEFAKLRAFTDYIALTPDGQRILTIAGDATDRIARELQVVVNWEKELSTR